MTEIEDLSAEIEGAAPEKPMLPAVTKRQAVATQSPFGSVDGFELAQRYARAIASSPLVPVSYQGDKNIGSVLIALDIANRTNASPLMVMQNLNIIHNKPSWGASFIIAALNSCGRFSPLRFDLTGEGDDRSCVAWATSTVDKQRLEGVRVSIAMAKREGWFDRNGSKWKTMPDLMLQYRAATFFGRLYAPDILMGMQTVEEVEDTTAPTVAVSGSPLREIPPGKVVESRGQALVTGKPMPAAASGAPAAPVAAVTGKALSEPAPVAENPRPMKQAKAVVTETAAPTVVAPAENDQPVAPTPQSQLKDFMDASGIEFDEIVALKIENGWLKDEPVPTSIASVSDKFAGWCLKNHKGLTKKVLEFRAKKAPPTPESADEMPSLT